MKIFIDKKEVYFLPVFLLTNAFNKGNAEKKTNEEKVTRRVTPKIIFIHSM